jgi:O-antigen/teichoic acid export membrane protein
VKEYAMKFNPTILFPIFLAGLRMGLAFLITKRAVSSLDIENFGKFQQFVIYFTMISTLSTGGISNLIVQRIASRSFDRKLSREIAGFLLLVVSVISIINLTNPSSISWFLFRTNQYFQEIMLVGLLTFPLALSNLILSIQIGQKQLKDQFYIYLIFSIFLLAAFNFLPKTKNFTTFLLYYSILMSLLIFFQYLYYFFNRNSANILSNISYSIVINRKSVQSFSAFASVMLIAIVSESFSQTYTRNLLLHATNWSITSFWQTAVRLTDVYMQVAGTLLLSHFYVRFADIKFMIRDIFTSFLKIMLFVSLAMIGIYLLKTQLIELLYKKEYLVASIYLLPLMLGDTVKVLNLVFAYFLLAKGRTLEFAAIYSSQALLWILFSHLTFNFGDQFFVLKSYIYAQFSTIFIVFLMFYFGFRMNKITSQIQT